MTTWRAAAWMTAYLAIMVINAVVILGSFISLGFWGTPVALLSLYLTLVFCFSSLEKIE